MAFLGVVFSHALNINSLGMGLKCQCWGRSQGDSEPPGLGQGLNVGFLGSSWFRMTSLELDLS